MLRPSVCPSTSSACRMSTTLPSLSRLTLASQTTLSCSSPSLLSRARCEFHSECMSPRPSYPEDNPSVRSDLMRSSYIVLKLLFALKLGCFSLGLILDIITFLPCLTREDCSFLHLLLLVSNLAVPLNNSSSRASTSEGSEASSVLSTSSRSKSSPGSSRSA